MQTQESDIYLGKGKFELCSEVLLWFCSVKNLKL